MERKINLNDLENALCDGVSIDELLDNNFDSLYVKELNCSYGRFDDKILNEDFKSYFQAKCREESRKNFNE